MLTFKINAAKCIGGIIKPYMFILMLKGIKKNDMTDHGQTGSLTHICLTTIQKIFNFLFWNFDV